MHRVLKPAAFISKCLNRGGVQFGQYTTFYHYQPPIKCVTERICSSFSSTKNSTLNIIELNHVHPEVQIQSSRVLNYPHGCPVTQKRKPGSPLFIHFQNPVRLTIAGKHSLTFSTFAPCLSCEHHKSGAVLEERAAPPIKIRRNVTNSSRQSEGTRVGFPSAKYKRIQDRTGQNFTRRVRRLKARVAYHNRRLQEKWSAQRFHGSAVVGKLRKKFQVKVSHGNLKYTIFYPKYSKAG